MRAKYRSIDDTLAILAKPEQCLPGEYAEARDNLLAGVPIPPLCSEFIALGAKVNRLTKDGQWECVFSQGQMRADDPRVVALLKKGGMK